MVVYYPRAYGNKRILSKIYQIFNANIGKALAFKRWNVLTFLINESIECPLLKPLSIILMYGRVMNIGKALAFQLAMQT